jgi:tetratricopeptide (TPR) repeat protein
MSPGKILQMVQKSTAKHTLVSDPELTNLLQSYEAGLRAMQEHKYDKAKGLLQKVVGSSNRELADRASVHLHACNQQLERDAIQFKTTEEHYDYVVSLINLGDYVSAREHLDKLSKQVPKADYVAYGLAALDCLTGHAEDALKNLARAIGLNPALRFQARNDADFQNLSEDPRFTELLYPDPGAEMPIPPEPEVGDLG